jgi:hypothetical protein
MNKDEENALLDNQPYPTYVEFPYLAECYEKGDEFIGKVRVILDYVDGFYIDSDGNNYSDIRPLLDSYIAKLIGKDGANSNLPQVVYYVKAFKKGYL